MIKKLLSISADAKTIKGEKLGYRTAILYLQPCSEVCPWSTKGCRQGCLNTAGRGRFNSTQIARKNKTAWYMCHDKSFVQCLGIEIDSFIKSSKKKNLKPCVRLNGTSDIKWENHFGLQEHQTIRFYDYTKGFKRILWNNQKKYHLTFSATEHTKWFHIWLLKLLGKNTAVVFRKELPKKYKGIKVINGDEHDLRFLDPKGVIVGLKAKGMAKKDTTGFVKDIENGN